MKFILLILSLAMALGSQLFAYDSDISSVSVRDVEGHHITLYGVDVRTGVTYSFDYTPENIKEALTKAVDAHDHAIESVSFKSSVEEVEEDLYPSLPCSDINPCKEVEDLGYNIQPCSNINPVFKPCKDNG
jgi:hypothetical protein